MFIEVRGDETTNVQLRVVKRWAFTGSIFRVSFESKARIALAMAAVSWTPSSALARMSFADFTARYGDVRMTEPTDAGPDVSNRSLRCDETVAYYRAGGDNHDPVTVLPEVEANNTLVTKTHFSSVIVAVYDINNIFVHGKGRTRDVFNKFVGDCMECQADYITGNGNLAANRPEDGRPVHQCHFGRHCRRP